MMERIEEFELKKKFEEFRKLKRDMGLDVNVLVNVKETEDSLKEFERRYKNKLQKRWY